MKILYLCADSGIPVLGRKGASVHVREMIAAFRRLNHTVILASPCLTKSPWEEPARVDASVMHIPFQQKMSSVKVFLAPFDGESTLPGELRRILYDQTLQSHLLKRFEDDPPDFIYERASLFSTAGVALASAVKRPILLELNAPLALEQSSYRGLCLRDVASRAEQWVLRNVQAVLPVSAPLSDYAISQGAEPRRIHVIPNGVDPAVFRPAPRRPEIRRRWNLGDGPILGFVGGLRPWHDVQILPPLLSRLPSAKLVIVGDGPLREELQAEFHRLGLDSRVLMTGLLPHEEVPPLIREFDVALVPYARTEHRFYFSPLKLFESLACGVPVVAAGLEQISEILSNGETGLLYPPGDLEALAGACHRLLGDPATRERIGRAGSELARTRYTWDQNARRVTELAHTCR